MEWNEKKGKEMKWKERKRKERKRMNKINYPVAII